MNSFAAVFFSTPSVGSVRHPCEKCGAIRAGRGMAGSSRPSLWILVLGCCLSPTLMPDRLCGITARWVRGCWWSIVWSRSARRHLASSSATSADGIPASLKRIGRGVVLYAGSIALTACTSVAWITAICCPTLVRQCGETAGMHTPHLNSTFRCCSLDLCHLSFVSRPPSSSCRPPVANRRGVSDETYWTALTKRATARLTLQLTFPVSDQIEGREPWNRCTLELSVYSRGVGVPSIREKRRPGTPRVPARLD